MSKLYNKSRVLGCKNPQKAGNSPQTVGKTVLPAQPCKNLENPTCSTQLATPFAAPAQCAAIEKLDNAAHEQGAAGVKSGKGVELSSTERRYVAGAENGSVLNESSNMHELKKADLSKFETQKSALGTAKKHSKVLRAVACGCLAILMCGTAFLGTACSGTPANVGLNGGGSAAAVGASGAAPAGVNYGNGTAGNAGQNSATGAEQNFATQSGGLITPRADDPVIFETKDGLEIKFGLTSQNFSTVASNGLAGYPYFNTTKNGTTYSWVIIGVGDGVHKNGPSAKAIFHDVQKQRMLLSGYPASVQDALSNAVQSEEIPSGAVLCLSNAVMSPVVNGYGDYLPANMVVNWHNSVNEDLFVQDACGLGNLKTKILETTIRSIGAVQDTNYTLYENDCYLFSLDLMQYHTDAASLYSYMSIPNFQAITYLNYAAFSNMPPLNVVYLMLARGRYGTNNSMYIQWNSQTSVMMSYGYSFTPSYLRVRPAFCIPLEELLGLENIY